MEGNGKVRDKRLENGIGHERAHDFFKGGQMHGGWGM